MAEASDTSSTSAPQHEPDHANPHPAWFAHLVRVEDAVEGASDDVMNQLVSLADDLADRIATTPATTRAGVIAQLQLFIRCYAGGDSDIADQALEQAVAGVRRLEHEQQMRDAARLAPHRLAPV